MAKKQPHEKKCQWNGFFEYAVDKTHIGIESGYDIENTLKVMMERHTNGGLIGYEDEKKKLAKGTKKAIEKEYNELVEELKEEVKKLYQSVAADYNAIQNNTFNPSSIDYEDETKYLYTIRYEILKCEKWFDELDRIIANI